MIELRKRKNIEEAMETGAEQQTLYTVLPEKRVNVGAAMMGSAHVYDMATVGRGFLLESVAAKVSTFKKSRVSFCHLETFTGESFVITILYIKNDQCVIQ